MANLIRIKRRSSGGSAGAPTSLFQAELAYNESDPGNGVLYIGIGTGGAGGTATSIVPIAGDGAYVSLTGTQTVSGAKTFSGLITLSGTAGNSAVGVTQSVNDNSTRLATTAYVLGQANSTAGTVAMNGTQAAGTSTLWARADHVHPSDTTKANLASPTFTGTPAAPTAAVDTNTTQVATTAFVLGQASAVNPSALGSVAIGTSTRYARADHVHAMPTLSQLGAPTANVAFGGFEITNLADPTQAQSAATKAYVDAVKTGLDVKDSCRAATTANITLSGTQTIDGVVLVAGDRVLVKDQTTASANGLYVVSATAWSRSTDADNTPGTGEVTAGMFTFIEEGTVNGDSGWVLTTNAPITLGTTSLAFAQFSGAGQITAGAGLTKTGNTLDVGGTANRITVNADTIDIAATYVGQSSITTLGTITTGTWTGTTIALANGGTGATTAAGARTNLGLVIGTDVQAYDAELATLAGMATATATSLAALTGTEAAVIDGSTAATATTLTATDTVVVNDAGVMKQVALSDVVTFLEDGVTSGFDLDGGVF